jgi:succinate dehydrogenase/fumarate reductase flavoprotein subunit
MTGEEREHMASRRRFGEWANAPETIPLSSCGKVFETEVLVVGAGIAGMTCAFSAAECGAKVTVMEKFGTYTARGFNIGVVNSSLMKKAGLHNDVDEVVREWIKRCGNRCDERIVRLFAEKSEAAMDWLLALVTRPEYAVRPELQGCIYKGETYYEIYGSHMFYDGPVTRAGKGRGICDVLEPMYQECLKLGTTFLFNTSLLQLIKDGDQVAGAVARDVDGDLVAVRASGGVVLATGGIGGNDEMCDDLCPVANKVAAKICGPKGCDNGDGHRAAYWAGASFEDDNFATIMHPQAHRHASFCFLFVDPNGRRFMNEDSYLQGRSLGVIKQGVKYCWSILDADWRIKVPATLPYGGGLYWGNDFPIGKGTEFQLEYEEEKMEWGLRNGFTVTADTPEELAEKMGVNVDNFVNTLRSYNEMCGRGRDTEFGKRKELLIPLDKPPFFARQFGPALLSVVGGVKVDDRMRVLTSELKPIPGLYAIGNTAGGRYGVDYPMLLPGNSHGTALTFGYLLGRELAGQK